MANQQEVSLQSAVADRLFVVPDYQRPYAWEQAQLEDLWEDLDVLGPHGRHYTGTLVLLPTGDEPVRTAFGQTLKPTDVVDGQQRLTTCLLLVDRIRRAFKVLAARGVEDADLTVAHLRETYGVVKTQGAHRPRLRLGSELNAFWTDTILGDHQASFSRPTSGHERLFSAVEFFDDKIKALTDGATDAQADAALHDLLTRVTDGLKFLVYEVDSAAEVGVIFETLNGRGKPLSELEKIKNYLLYIVRGFEADRAEELAALVNTEWAGIFTDLAGLSINEDRLLRAHWLATQRPNPKTWQGASSVKDLFSRRKYVRDHDRLGLSISDDASLIDPDGNFIETYVRQLRLCALFVKETYDPGAAFASFTTGADRARANSAALRRSRNVANFQPLLFACRLAHPKDGEAYADLVRACEIYAARVYTITQRRSNAGQTALYSLAHRLAAGKISVVDAIGEVGALAWTYADDDRTLSALALTENWYYRPGHKYFLYEYELSKVRSGAHAPNYADFTGDRYNHTTEHIAPQTPDWENDDWKDLLTRDEHALLKHSLGNLVLTYDNSSYSNKGFASKKGQPGQVKPPCYATAPLAQEREIAEYQSWGRKDMEDRLEKLRAFAMSRWPLAAPSAAVVEALDEFTEADAPVDDDGDDAIDPDQNAV